ncbi:MAG: four helix bundle protein [Rhodanobacter sp.]|nr:MAG: four helix bundle protein [Rhodanobacter sp.]
MDLVEAIYRISATFPDFERFALSQQIRRAVVSVPSNIAEGAARKSTSEYLRFLSIARGSLAELDTQLHIAERLDYTTFPPDAVELVNCVFAKLNALIRSLQPRES